MFELSLELPMIIPMAAYNIISTKSVEIYCVKRQNISYETKQTLFQDNAMRLSLRQ